MTQLLVLAAACALLSTLESVIPLFGRRGLRRMLPNLGLAAIVLLSNLTLSLVTASLSASREVSVLMSIGGVIALDVSAYLAHVALHKFSLGWRVHRLHHSDADVDVTTAFRQHPLETLWRVAWQWPAVALLGLPMSVVTIYVTLSGVNALAEHANIRVQPVLDRALRLVFVTPAMHKVHHSRVQRETDSNYANILSVWDRMFGTYTRDADFATLRYGL